MKTVPDTSGQKEDRMDNEGKTVKRTFEIEYPERLGEMWMNEENLKSIMFTTDHVGDEGVIVKDVTEGENCKGEQ